MNAYALLDWFHILIMGYWIGSDLVVNQLTHYVAHAAALPGAERQRLWDFLLDVDQHPRNALILSVPSGFTLAAMTGLVPLGATGLVVLWILAALWFAYMWFTHLRRTAPAGARLAAWDWRSRYVLIAACWGFGGGSLASGWPFATAWLAWKVILFGAVMACGIAIRHYIREAYAAWPRIWADAGTPDDEACVRRAMLLGTRWLWLLWLLLFAIGYLGVTKP